MDRPPYLPFFLSILVFSTGVASGGHCGDQCCFEKIVGGVKYRLVREGPTGDHGCLSNCIYEMVEAPGNSYCFAQGNLNAVCEEYAEFEYCSPNQQLATRMVTVDITPESEEETILNNALEVVKSWKAQNSDKNWTSIGGYHGKPFMCNTYKTGWGDEHLCCIHHDDGPPGTPGHGRQADFVTWHRLYVYQMEQSFRLAEDRTVNSLGIPYWDWTDPIYNNSLPKFAQQGPWKNGKIPLGARGERGCTEDITVRNLTAKFDNTLLRDKVHTAFCTKNFRKFNFQIQIPHDLVHCMVGRDSSMCNQQCTAYDPLFYLHHSNVDRQYAFWQTLREVQGHKIYARDVPMFPFADPNTPCYISRDHSSGAQTLNYKQDFRYKYDDLRFTWEGEIYTPQEFADNYLSICGPSALFAACPLKSTGISSNIKYKIVPTYVDREYVEIQTFGRSGRPDSYTYHQYDLKYVDVTKYVNDINDTNITFDIYSYTDTSGEPLPKNETYQCVVAYKPQNVDQHIYRVHEHKLAKYAPIMYGEPGSKIELYEEDGTRSSQPITEIFYNGTETEVDKDNVVIQYQEHQYRFGVQKITFGFYPDFECINETPEPSDKYFKWAANIPEIFLDQGAEAYLAWCVGMANVYQFPNEAEFNACANVNSTGSRPGPHAFRIPTYGGLPGPLYYANGEPGKCTEGWKVKINFV